jgi:hypothetical protein
MDMDERIMQKQTTMLQWSQSIVEMTAGGQAVEHDRDGDVVMKM